MKVYVFDDIGPNDEYVTRVFINRETAEYFAQANYREVREVAVE